MKETTAQTGAVTRPKYQFSIGELVTIRGREGYYTISNLEDFGMEIHCGQLVEQHVNVFPVDDKLARNYIRQLKKKLKAIPKEIEALEKRYGTETPEQ